jgi:tryptophan-rich sensory protein
MRRILRTAAAVLACNIVGVTGALFTSTDTAWYGTLVKPAFQPPGWLFGPVWTLLYTLMGIALFRVVERRRADGARFALWLFAGQLMLNGIWTPIFFGAEAIGLALAVIVMLVGLVALTIRHFMAVDRGAGWLLVPYLAWLSFATMLNATIVALN